MVSDDKLKGECYCQQIKNIAGFVISLGNNFTITEREIVDFPQRVADFVKTVGLSGDDIQKTNQTIKI